MKSIHADSQRSFLRSVGNTAGFSLAGTAVSAITGVMLARWLGPSGRGDYAAVASYFGLALVFFDVGLGSSIVFHVSKYRRAHADYVWTAMGLYVPLALAGALVSVVLAVTVFGESPSRRAAFLVIPFAIAFSFANFSALFALQSLDLRRWNLARLSQPVIFSLLVIGVHQSHPHGLAGHHFDDGLVGNPIVTDLVAIRAFLRPARTIRYPTRPANAQVRDPEHVIYRTQLRQHKL